MYASARSLLPCRSVYQRGPGPANGDWGRETAFLENGPCGPIRWSAVADRYFTSGSARVAVANDIVRYRSARPGAELAGSTFLRVGDDPEEGEVNRGKPLFCRLQPGRIPNVYLRSSAV
jgi:hypothetical protein